MTTTTTWRCSSSPATRTSASTPPPSAGEDSTGLSGWSIKNRFDWKDGNTWKHKGGSSNEAILIIVNGYDTRVQQEATGRPVILASAEGAPYLFADTSGIADGNGLPFTGSEDSVIEFTYSYQWIRVDGGTEANVGADSPRYRLVDADIGKQIKVEVSFTDVHNFSETVTQPAVRPGPQTGLVAVPVDAGQQHRPVGVGHGEYHPAVRPGVHVGRPRPGLRAVQRLDRPGGGPD